jgi:CheY-like chemotaxis protein
MLQRLIGEDIELRLALLPDLGRVHADPGHIEQVLMNLVVNARDAMPRGGTIAVETANAALDEGHASRHDGAKPGPYVLLTVSDTGTGMDEATQARLFEPFFTTKSADKGTGLGLSTVLGIIKQSSGALEVSSAPGHGTSVKMYLPRIDLPVAIESQEPKTRVAGGSETILLVEDDDMLRNLLREALEREGYHVLDAPGPAAARRLAQSHTAPIQLLITDVVMPRGSGRELAELLSSDRPELKVLYISGYADSAVAGSGMRLADAAFLQKPFTPAALAEKVREVLGGDGKTNHAGK